MDGLGVVDSDDPTKLALALPGTGADGLEVEADLFAQGIRFELANRDLLVPLLTIADTEEGVERLCDALVARSRADGASRGRRGRPARSGTSRPRRDDPARGVLLPAGDRAAEDAAGRVAAEMVCPYPPGIPAIAPGEVVSRELVEALREAAAAGTRLSYCADPGARRRCRSSRQP